MWHNKIIHKLQNGLITEAVKHLEFKPLSEINRNGNGRSNNGGNGNENKKETIFSYLNLML
jgi:hypothetical protein